MAEFVLDFGNARVKWHNPRVSKFGDFRHAIAPLDESDWRSIAGRGKPPKGIVKVNGAPFAIGDAARRYVISERPKGASRYKETYYGPALGFALAQAFGRSVPKVFLVASHAPQDISYAELLRAAAQRYWEVECEFGVLEFNVVRVETFDEPIGGYSNYVLTEDGDERKKNALRNETTLIVDVGGYTVDVAAVDPGAQIDPLSLKSTRAGVIKMTSDFEDYIRSNNRTIFQDTGDLDIRRIESAILTGEYKFGNQRINCVDEANGVLNSLVNDVVQVIDAAGGAANYDYILLTGGGSALIYDKLVYAYPRINFLLSEENRENLKFSNVFGGAKLSALMKTIGEW